MIDTVIPLFGPIPGGPELLIILLVLVLLFGANKIPKLARSTGQAMGEFQKGREEVEDELEQMRQGKGSRDDEEDEPTPDIGADSTEADRDTDRDAVTERETETERNN
ncbi:sec-independent protein translocase protein TatA [Halogranum amylolyticum]|uniref:Sec-independent protein translocase protein TatA n=1 Tax=Halogranum amylolyticum TaxID=660520 RepID=A0A1H8P1W6_9EURY|nr:twin-arginine translocase TatA/TatE family subunit [Halogranum amylolyticum]SEO35598.1 sec-independent protein translocase protein TatA [Halogranum amylolyticum]